MEDAKVGLFVPTFPPFTFHWYDGVVPPLTGAAVNVIFVPAQTVPAGFAEMFTLALRFGFTVIEIMLDVTGFAARHVPLEYISHST